MLDRRAVVLLSIVAGVVLELGIQAIGGRREAWDAEEYWTVGLPCVLVASAGLGYFSKNHAWIWTLLIIPSQVTTMMVRSGEIGALWPLAVVLSAVLSTPFVVAAFLGSRLRPRS
ncbi:MAG TPA: hypothetical protein VF198_05600 [Vicinamibacterales bacterium]